MALANEANARGHLVLALAYLASLDPESIGACREALMKHRPYLDVEDRLATNFLLWQATQDPANLREAHRLLEDLIDHAPADCRDSMIENVPLNRDIMQAWAEHGGD